MVSTRTPTKTWVAREGLFQIGKYPTVVLTSTAVTLSGAFVASGYEISSAMKNITVTPPETSWEKQDLLGKTNDFQNQLLDEKPVGIATLTGTLVLGEAEQIEDLLISGTATAVTGGYSRYQLGTSKTSDNRVTAVVTVWNATNSVSFGLQDARITKWGDVKISGPDSHWEQDLTLICLAKNFYYEFKD